MESGTDAGMLYCKPTASGQSSKTMTHFFWTEVIAIIATFSCGYFLMSIARIGRDESFARLATAHHLSLNLNYKQYSFGTLVWPGEIIYLRMLSGTLNGKRVCVQDSLAPWVLLSHAGTLIYFTIPAGARWMSGASTKIFVDGVEENISNRGFWAISSLAPASEIDLALRSI